MTDIVAFLRARLDEDEQGAREALDQRSGEWFVGDKWNVYGVEDETPHEDYETNELIVYGNCLPQSEHIARHDPARVLREVKAKREILTVCNNMLQGSDPDAEVLADVVVRALATVHAAHPDYNPAWSVDA